MPSSAQPTFDPHPLSPYVSWTGNRNRDSILEVLKKKLPTTPGNVLELASGSGMHINYFAPHLKHLTFFPSDKDSETFDNIKKITQAQGITNIVNPSVLDLSKPDSWFSLGKPSTFTALLYINTVQIAPITFVDSMLECAVNLLTDDGFLMIYGPFKGEGGLKEIAGFKQAAANYDLLLKEQIHMPANNVALLFGKTE